jgi:hypothetical protein
MTNKYGIFQNLVFDNNEVLDWDQMPAFNTLVATKNAEDSFLKVAIDHMNLRTN